MEFLELFSHSRLIIPQSYFEQSSCFCLPSPVYSNLFVVSGNAVTTETELTIVYFSVSVTLSFTALTYA